jgi:hypothetical protein
MQTEPARHRAPVTFGLTAPEAREAIGTRVPLQANSPEGYRPERWAPEFPLPPRRCFDGRGALDA